VYAYGVRAINFENGKVRFKRANTGAGKVNFDYVPGPVVPSTTVKVEVATDSTATSFTDGFKPTVAADYSAEDVKAKITLAPGLLVKA
jgi:hypothetical protein